MGGRRRGRGRIAAAARKRREKHAETRAAAGRGVHHDVASELVDDPVNARESHPAALAHFLRREERFEDPVKDRRRDSGPVVLDAELDEIAGGGLAARRAYVLTRAGSADAHANRAS